MPINDIVIYGDKDVTILVSKDIGLPQFLIFIDTEGNEIVVEFEAIPKIIKAFQLTQEGLT